MANRIDPLAWDRWIAKCNEVLPRTHPAFVAKVRHELALIKIGEGKDVRVRTCQGCACLLDDKTDGCSNCSARHGMRKLKERRRANQH